MFLLRQLPPIAITTTTTTTRPPSSAAGSSTGVGRAKGERRLLMASPETKGLLYLVGCDEHTHTHTLLCTAHSRLYNNAVFSRVRLLLL